MELRDWVVEAVDAVAKWQAGWGPYPEHDAVTVPEDLIAERFAELRDRLADNYPFFHPRYAGQMLKPPHPAAVVGYLTAMLINPNNHALDGGPATAQMEKEAVASLAAMFGLPEHLGHLTSSGTIANLEALFVARETHPGAAVAFSAESHYTHARMCQLIGVPTQVIPVDGAGRIDLSALDDVLRAGAVGTVVVTAGTTGLGAVDPIDEVLVLTRRHGVRVHVDAAYGGFYTLLAGRPDGLPARPWQAIADCDSVVVDPHKHGLQPYGCGAVLFRDPSVGRFYRHDSPYTYFTSTELHLGEISLECSRAGAAAAALWLTQQVLPLTADGLGAVLAANLRAARRWAGLIDDSEFLTLYQEPQLDIVTYFPAVTPPTSSGIDQASAAVMHTGMTSSDPVFLSVLQVGADALTGRHPAVSADSPGARVLRSVLMKPESDLYLDRLHRRVEELAAACTMPATP